MFYPGRPYYGYGGPPPPHGYPPGYPPGTPGHPPPMYPPPGVIYYPYHPAYFYPYPPPPGPVDVVENAEPEEIVPELPGETVELPWSKF